MEDETYLILDSFLTMITRVTLAMSLFVLELVTQVTHVVCENVYICFTEFI